MQGGAVFVKEGKPDQQLALFRRKYRAPTASRPLMHPRSLRRLHTALLTVVHSGEFPGALKLTAQAPRSSASGTRASLLRTEVAAAVVRLSAALEGALLSMAASKDLDELERADGSALRRRRW